MAKKSDPVAEPSMVLKVAEGQYELQDDLKRQSFDLDGRQRALNDMQQQMLTFIHPLQLEISRQRQRLWETITKEVGFDFTKSDGALFGSRLVVTPKTSSQSEGKPKP